MNPVPLLIFCLLLATTPAFAVSEVIPMKNEVRFNHFNHMNYTETCFQCHTEEPGRIKGFGKEWGHGNCKGCHTRMTRGPQRCSGCHKWNENAPND
ncbi:cytochrome c3 family protein [Geotalea sp. SG265]|uniref:cytochrome c3 family protein n=1 Tax=Geotalea sp. SG265 TaxID=2922867 RepID=UPI001FAEF46C|nr:cytochrome c3 family protein [Geotalea sp. SG265]